MYNRTVRFAIISSCFISGLLFPTLCFAARDITISGNKSSLFDTDELTITASVSGFTKGETINIKGAFFKEGSSNYFGYTKNGNDWVKNGDTSSDQKQIIPDQWDGVLISKSDFSDSGFSGEGDYFYKVGFYYIASGGSLSSVNWSENQLPIHLVPPSPTPTLEPTPAHTSTPTLQPTTAPTLSPSPVPTMRIVQLNSITPKKLPTKFPTPTERPSELTASQSGVVAGALSEATPSGKNETPSKNSLLPVASSLLFVGTGLALLSGVYVWKKRNVLVPNPPPKS